MKKNTMMRIASFLLIAVLLSTSAISGTYAKYVTRDTAMDSARVAKWGVQIDAADTTFAEAYDAKAEGNDPAADKTSTAVTVRSDLTHGSINNLVAPGTNGKMAEIGLEGKPEVDCTVSYSVKTFDINGWNLADNSLYFPIIIKVYHNNALVKTFDGKTYTDETTLENDIKTFISGLSASYDANTDLSSAAVLNNNLDIEWEWPFEVGTTPEEVAEYDKKDTYLGDCAAGLYSGKGAATIAFEFDVIVTQVD